MGRELDRGTRWIKEAVCIQKEGKRSINRDEGSYTLKCTTRFLPFCHLTIARTGRRNDLLLLMKVYDRDQNVKVKQLFG